MDKSDWHAWHEAYDVPGSHLARRLEVVQEQVGRALEACPPGPLRAISVCAGQGRDLLGVLTVHPRRDDVTARLVELDPDNAEIAVAAATSAGLSGVEVVLGDAALTAFYADLVPVDLVLLCGVFGNIVDGDIERTVAFCPQLCRTGATVIWTRHRKPPDLVPQICAWFERYGFEQQWVSDPDESFGVVVHRFAGEPQPLARSRMFTFVGWAGLPPSG
jgi:hypothetical protein